MISSVVLYFMQSAICMAFFYALYWLFLKRDTFFWVNRIFLLLTLFAAILIPSLEIPIQLSGSSSEYPVIDAVVIASQEYFNSNMLDEVVVTADVDQSLSWYQYLGIFYFIGVFIFAVRFVKNSLQLFLWSKRSEHKVEDGAHLVLMDGDYPPFSFLNRIFVSKEDYSKNNFKAILEHEKVHVNQLHTFDLLVLELLTVLFWLNPIIWFYKSSLQEVHEYLADDEVVNGSVNPNEYKMQIVNQFAGGDLFRLANNFGQSTLKKRISMLGKIKTSKIALVKLLLLIPILAFLFSAFAFTIKEEKKMSSNMSFNDLILDDLKKFYSFTDYYSRPEENDSVHFVSENNFDNISNLSRKKESDNSTYVLVEEMPEFPGGIQNLQKYISHEIQYPREALKKSLGGRVFVSFVVNKKGEVVNSRISRGIDKSLNEEALRVISSLPKWIPGKQKGVAVNVSFTVPVSFNVPNYFSEPVSQKSPLYARIKNASDYHFQNQLKVKRVRKAFTIVEKMPEFPGGTKGLRKYIARKLRYPILAVEQGYEGKVFVRFLVREDGSVSDAEILKGANIELNEEALRVIKSMPKWVPGEQYGRKVSVSYTIPIRFSLN